MFLRLLLTLSLGGLPGTLAWSAAAADAWKYEEPKTLDGRIYLKDSNQSKPLFTFKRTATRDGSRLNVLREYTDSEGQPAARERVIYEGDALISYELEELQIEAAGSAKLQRDPRNPSKGKILFEYKQSATTESLQNDTLIADMVGPFLKSHWDSLMSGKKVKCRYIVVPRKETVGFTFTRESEKTRDGKPVVVVKMEPTSAILSSLVDPLFFVIERGGRHRVLEYVGRTTPKVRQGNRWKNLDAKSVFDWGN